MNISAVILAAGKGTRMKSSKPKVVHEVLHKPMIKHVVDELKKANVNDIVVVVGHLAKQVELVLKDDNVSFVYQKELLGTGHAVLQAASLLEGKDGITFVLNGDAPAIEAKTIQNMIKTHTENNNQATIMTCKLDRDNAFGRIIKKIDGSIECITEFKDANFEERKINEINAGEYCFDNQLLFSALRKIKNNNVQNEYYLTDLAVIFNEMGLKVSSYEITDFNEIGGINDRIDLANANEFLKNRINNKHLLNGVTIIDPKNTYIGRDVEIGEDTIIEPGCIIKGKTIIGKDCLIGAHSELDSTIVKDRVILKQVVISDSIIESGVDIGPFARLRANCHILENVHIGNFVEMKNTEFGLGSKSAHLSYIGDAVVGKDVNIGCGTITSNYDGLNKFKTIIKDKAFIGCNSNLVAPVTIEEEGYVVAGSTITKNVSGKAVAFGRSKQINKEGYATVLKERREAIKKGKK